jgi:hypothetical protein
VTELLDHLENFHKVRAVNDENVIEMLYHPTALQKKLS